MGQKEVEKMCWKRKITKSGRITQNRTNLRGESCKNLSHTAWLGNIRHFLIIDENT